jgi:hypothetical protein
MVRITIVGRDTAPVTYPDGSNAEAVVKGLVTAYGPGLLRKDENLALSELLTGDYEFHITGETGKTFCFHSF